MKRNQIRHLTHLAMMLAMISVLSYVEHTLPPLPFLPPGVRLGLSNIITMYVLFFMGWQEALVISVLKSLFVFMMRGSIAGFLSICGGLLSIGVILLLMWVTRKRASYLILSICGAVSHNIGQLAGVALALKNPFALSYLPILLVSGVLMGIVTGLLLRVVMPMFDRITKK